MWYKGGMKVKFETGNLKRLISHRDTKTQRVLADGHRALDKIYRSHRIFPGRVHPYSMIFNQIQRYSTVPGKKL